MTDPIDTLARARRYFKSIVMGLDNEIFRCQEQPDTPNGTTLVGLEVKAREMANELKVLRIHLPRKPFIVSDEEEFEARAASIDEDVERAIKGEDEDGR